MTAAIRRPIEENRSPRRPAPRSCDPRSQNFVARREARNISGKLDTFAALTVPTMSPLVCYAASGLAYPREAQSEAAEKGAKRAIVRTLPLGPTRRRRSPLATAASPQAASNPPPGELAFASMGAQGIRPSSRRGGGGGCWRPGDSQAQEISPFASTWKRNKPKAHPKLCFRGPFCCFPAPSTGDLCYGRLQLSVAKATSARR